MMLRFSGLMTPVELNKGSVSVLEISNKRLYSRICQSIVSLSGNRAVEPYSVWDDEEISPAKVFFVVSDVFILPWNDRRLSGLLWSCVESLVRENESVRSNVEELSRQLSACVERAAFQVEGDYRFDVEWDLLRYLKTFSFGVDRTTDASLVDNLIKFIDYVADIRLGQVLVFINLKSFLVEEDLKRLYDRVFFRGISMFLLENAKDLTSYDHETKVCVDQDFLEY